MDRIIVIRRHAADEPRALRVEVIAELRVERLLEGYAVVAALLGGAPACALGAGLSRLQADALWLAVTDWLTRHGSAVFDTAEHWKLQAQLARAGTMRRGRSIRGS